VNIRFVFSKIRKPAASQAVVGTPPFDHIEATSLCASRDATIVDLEARR